MTIFGRMLLRRLMDAYWPHKPRTYINPKSSIVFEMIALDPTASVYRDWPDFKDNTILSAY